METSLWHTRHSIGFARLVGKLRGTPLADHALPTTFVSFEVVVENSETRGPLDFTVLAIDSLADFVVAHCKVNGRVFVEGFWCNDRARGRAIRAVRVETLDKNGHSIGYHQKFGAIVEITTRDAMLDTVDSQAQKS